MIKPFLFIGVGGAGGKTLRAISAELHEQLNAIGYQGTFPDAWQFLHIDTTVVQDGVHLDIPMLAPDQYHGVVPTGFMYGNLLNKVMSLGDSSMQKEILGTWALPNREPGINTSRSLQRAIGRLASISDLRGIDGALRKSISQMLNPQALPQLETLSKFFPDHQVISEPEVFIFSSLAGGTGSGMFLDVVDTLSTSTHFNWASKSNVLLYTNDVFEEWKYSSLDFDANALAALSELLARRSSSYAEESKRPYELNGLIYPSNTDQQSEVFFIGKKSFLSGAVSDNSMYFGGEQLMMEVGRSFADSLLIGQCDEWLMSHPVATLSLSRDIYGRNTFGNSLSKNFLTIEEITKPILKQIDRCRFSPQSWDFFWEGRRTRPFVEAIPFSNENRHLIIMGWFLASLFGLRKTEYSANERRALIWNYGEEHQRWVSFPVVLSPQSSNDEVQINGILPAVLNSATIALLSFGDSKDTSHLESYHLLRGLGSEVCPDANKTPSNDFFAVELNEDLKSESIPHLRNWLSDGTTPTGIYPRSPLIEREYPGLEERKEALLGAIARRQKKYEESWASFDEVNWSKMPDTWELREEIDSALRAISTYVEGIS